MDETVMIDWIDLILAPYVAAAPDGIVPVMFLDSYQAHMMQSVVTRIQALGVDVFHIPAGPHHASDTTSMIVVEH